jgi:hypothetical protein
MLLAGTGDNVVTDLKVAIASDFNTENYIYNGLCYEACLAIASTCNATILSPKRAKHGGLWNASSRLKSKILGIPRSPAQKLNVSEKFDCFLYICMNPENLLSLQALQGWQGCARRSAAFLYETWTPKAYQDRRYLKMLDHFDHVFLLGSQSINEVMKYTTTPCSFLPSASDCLKAAPTSFDQPRTIDVYGMGRTLDNVHQQLIDMTRTGELFYLWDHQPGAVTGSFDVARLRTHHLIRQSRFFTSFNFSRGGKSETAAGEDAIATRLFEGAAGGAVQIGSKPQTPHFERLFDWQDALIEIPDDPLNMKDFYAQLQADPGRIRRASLVSTSQALRRHDWGHRWEIILQTLGLPIPEGLQRRKEELQARALKAEALLDSGRTYVRGSRRKVVEVLRKSTTGLPTIGARNLAMLGAAGKMSAKFMIIALWGHHIMALRT